MAKGLALHIGVDKVNRDHRFVPNIPQLRCAENDARELQRLTSQRGMLASVLLVNEFATRERVLREITLASNQLQDGDFFILTFSGHGLSGPDKTKLEISNEYWCLCDRVISDDTLTRLLLTFEKGVRILIVSDCCYAAGIVDLKHIKYNGKHQVILMAATSEYRLARQLEQYSLFLFHLKQQLESDDFDDYPGFFEKVEAAMIENDQTPHIEYYGESCSSFKKMKPFRI